MKRVIEIKLHVTDYLDKAFDLLPANANVNKGRCGSGGTTLEILAPRPSIIIVPTNGTITDKCNAHPNLFAVNGGVTVNEVERYLTSGITNKKLMVTPDSFYKIIEAASNINMLDDLYREYFLLMDESHAAITERFRKNMLAPFKYFSKFSKRSLISATPFPFSDEQFTELTQYNITFHEPYIGNIIVRPTNSIEAAVDHYIQNRDTYPGKQFYFYNSVTEIAETIRRNKLTDCHVYCADKADNFNKLPEHLLAFQREPVTGHYAAVNFFTSKYFEGLDVVEANANVFLVTDVNKNHTKVGITNKGVQAVGRLRKPPRQIVHITNHRNTTRMKTLNQFREEYATHTTKLIDYYNNYIEDCKMVGIEPLETMVSTIESFAELDELTKLATLNKNKLDQVLNELACNEEFNNIEGIVSAWERSLYKVDVNPFVGHNTKKRMSKASKLRELIDLIDELNKGPLDYVYGQLSKQLKDIQRQYPFAFEAYFLLGKEKLHNLKYNDKLISQAMIEQHNKDVEPKLLSYLDTKLNIGNKQTIEELTAILQYGYNLFQIRNPKTGKVKVAMATQLGEPGRYRIDKTKIDVGGIVKNGFKISGRCFAITKAA